MRPLRGSHIDSRPQDIGYGAAKPGPLLDRCWHAAPVIQAWPGPLLDRCWHRTIAAGPLLASRLGCITRCWRIPLLARCCNTCSSAAGGAATPRPWFRWQAASVLHPCGISASCDSGRAVEKARQRLIRVCTPLIRVCTPLIRVCTPITSESLVKWSTDEERGLEKSRGPNRRGASLEML